MDVAKAIALGADIAGIAAPLLRSANISDEAVIENMAEIIKGLSITMFCIGASNISELKGSPFLEKTKG
jgi:isopentenyl-diphosphate delta-isomerase